MSIEENDMINTTSGIMKRSEYNKTINDILFDMYIEELEHEDNNVIRP